MQKYFLVLLTLMLSFYSCGQTKNKTILEEENYVTDLVIKNVSVITMKTNEAIKNQDVVVKKGKIVSISNSKGDEYKNMATIDGSNKYMMPSLSDAHVHLPKDEDELKKFLTLNLINGVTKLRSMRGDWNHLQWREKYNTDTSIYPKLYLSAPPISRNHNFSTQQLTKFIDKAKAFDFIKILSIKDETAFKELDRLCKVENIKIGGHFPSNVSDATLFKSNYTSFEHLGGLTGPPGVLENRLQAIKNKNIFICPTLSWYSIGSGRYSLDESRNLPGMQYISKTIVDEWIEKTKNYREKLGAKAYNEEVESELLKLEQKYQVIKRLNAVGVTMLLSPDSSSKYMIPGFGVVGEMELLKKAELTNYEILKMATVNFANFFNEDNGVIEEGKAADFILLKNNPLENINALKTIEGVFINSNYLNKEALNKLSQSIFPN